MMYLVDRQRQCMSKSREKSSDHGRASKMAALELTPQENLRLLQEVEANRRFILLAYQSDPELLRRADPEIRRLFKADDQPTLAPAGEQVSTAT